MKPRFRLSFFILLLFFVSCSKKIEQETVYFEDEKGRTLSSNEEVVIDDNNLVALRKAKLQSVNREPKTASLIDGPTISESFDNAGNKTESRCFDNHPRIGCVVLKTDAKGAKTINIFAQNGEVKTVAPDALENILEISPDEIASAAGITEGKKEQPQMTTAQNRAKTPTQPMPTQKFPVYNNAAPPVVEQTVTETETDEQTANVITQNKPEAEDN